MDALLDEVLGDRGEDQADTKGACWTCEARGWISIWQVPDLIEPVETEERELTHEESLRVALALPRFGVLRAGRLAVSYGFICEADRGVVDVEDPADVWRLFGLEDDEEDRDRPPPRHWPRRRGSRFNSPGRDPEPRFERFRYTMISKSSLTENVCRLCEQGP